MGMDEASITDAKQVSLLQFYHQDEYALYTGEDKVTIPQIDFYAPYTGLLKNPLCHSEGAKRPKNLLHAY
jgi:hypothetical protein